MILSSTNSLAQTTNLNPNESRTIAQKLIDGQICQFELQNTQSAYKSCIDDHYPAPSFWAKPEVEIGAGITLSLLGFVLGVTHCFGSCK